MSHGPAIEQSFAGLSGVPTHHASVLRPWDESTTRVAVTSPQFFTLSWITHVEPPYTIDSYAQRIGNLASHANRRPAWTKDPSRQSLHNGMAAVAQSRTFNGEEVAGVGRDEERVSRT